jgi:hypothetical protein
MRSNRQGSHANMSATRYLLDGRKFAGIKLLRLIWYPLEPETGLVRGSTSTNQNLNGHHWHLNGHPLEPEMGAFCSLMLLPMVPNVRCIPLLPYLYRLPGGIASD